MILGFPRAKQGLCHYDILGGGGGAQSLIRSPSKTAEKNFMKLKRNCSQHDAILHLLFKIFIRMILGFPRAKQGLCHTNHGGAGGIIL